MLLLVVSLFFLAAYALLISFYYRHWQALQSFTPAGGSSVFVSVIIAARNEEKTLPLLLQDLQLQDYSPNRFEVIIVNDFSTDGTGSLATTLPSNFRMIEPDCAPEQSSKKKAIATGVTNAKGALLLITDADCRIGENWISTMSSFYAEKEAAFIAAPVKYVCEKSSLLQVLQVLDFITLQGITAASVSAGFHSMCNGANLAYTKKAFETVNGFEGIDRLPTGDDMLLMHKIRKQNLAKVFYLKSREAIVSTAPMPTWKEFFRQRRRWASKTLVYDDRRIIAVLGFVLLLNLLAFVLLIAGFYQKLFLVCLLIFLFAKSMIEWPFVASVARFFGQQRLMRFFLFLQPLHIIYTVFAGIGSQIGRYEWKGRRAE